MALKPLWGIPVVVGISDAVIAMRSVVSAIAGWYDSKTAAVAKMRESLMSMTVLRPTIAKSAFSGLAGEWRSKFQASREFAAELGIPATLTPVAVLCLGYPTAIPQRGGP